MYIPNTHENNLFIVTYTLSDMYKNSLHKVLEYESNCQIANALVIICLVTFFLFL